MLGLVCFGCAGCHYGRVKTQEEIYKAAQQYFAEGNLLEVQRLASKGYEHSRPGTLDRTRFLLELARGRLYQGYADEAYGLLKQPLPSSTTVDLDLQHSTLLAMALIRSGRPEAGAAELNHAVHANAGKSVPLELEFAQGIADLDAGRLDQAESSFKRALSEAVVSGNQPLQINSQVNLGVVALREEHFEEALNRLKQAQGLAADASGLRLVHEKIAGNVGVVYYRLGETERALDNLKLAEAESRSIGATGDELYWRNEEGDTLARAGELDQAKSLYETSLQQAREMHAQEGIYDAALALGGLLRTLDQREAANYLDEAGAMAKRRGNPQEELTVRLARAELLAGPHPAQAEAQLLGIEADPQTTTSLRWQAQQAMALLHLQAGEHAVADAWFVKALHTFQQQRGSVQQVEFSLPFYENGVHLYRDFIEHLIAEGKTDQALAVLDQSRAKSLLSETGTSGNKNENSVVATAQQFAAKVDGALLIYYLLPEHSYLWAISRDRTGLYRLPGKAEITQLVRRHRQLMMSEKNPFETGDEAGQELYRLLVKPALPQIKPGQGVYVLADGVLNELNFETLLTPGPRPHFWIEDVTITNAASLRLLTKGLKKAEKKTTEELLLVGNPAYPAGQGLELPHAAQEVTRVETHFPKRRTVLTGESATATGYIEEHPERFSYIHFVAHAGASLKTPMDSFVLLAGGSDRLYARDILSHPLKANLVVLSSCYSSGTRNYSGEGLVGLAWSFERAGARNVIGALWEVSDDSTPELMDHLYADLAAGRPPDQALRNAKLAVLHSPGKFNRPFYWAPFQLYSNSVPSLRN